MNFEINLGNMIKLLHKDLMEAAKPFLLKKLARATMFSSGWKIQTFLEQKQTWNSVFK